MKNMPYEIKQEIRNYTKNSLLVVNLSIKKLMISCSQQLH